MTAFIKFDGKKSSDFDLRIINDFETGLENVQSELVIDMERHLVYKDVLSAWDNIVRTERHRMPLFDVGQNKISWTGSFTITAVPNWGVKV